MQRGDKGDAYSLWTRETAAGGMPCGILTATTGTWVSRHLILHAAMSAFVPYGDFEVMAMCLLYFSFDVKIVDEEYDHEKQKTVTLYSCLKLKKKWL